MLSGLKINSALLLCTAFIFRLLFVNAGVISSLHTQYSKYANARFANTIKRHAPCEASANLKGDERSLLEICETDADDDDKFKVRPSVLSTLVYLLVTKNLSYSVQKVIPSGDLVSGSLPQRYLLFQVFRI